MPSPRTFTQTFDFTHPPEKVWGVVSNSDRMNRAMGIPPVEYRTEPSPPGGSTRIGRFRRYGIEMAWHEPPHEWIQHEFVHVDRGYFKGPMRRMLVKRALEPTPTGCRLTQTTTYTPASALLVPLLAIEVDVKVRKAFHRAFAHAERYLNRQATAPYEPLRADPRAPDPARLKQVRRALEAAQLPPPVIDRMAELLLTSQEPDLVRIRPFAMARQWGLSRRDALEAFLKATRAGVLNLSWDLICPNCRGAKLQAATLSGLRGQAHCDSCGIQFGAEFDRSVELTFAPHPSVREVRGAEYCVGSPSNTAHFLMQLRLPPGESRAFRIAMEPGLYRFRSLQSPKRYSFEVTAERKPEGPVQLEFRPMDEAPVRRPLREGQVEFEARNGFEHEVVLTLERGEYSGEACTAAFATTQQSFRDLFSSEVLSADQRIHVSSVTLLFTDLKDSTALYRKIGDARAFALVNRHLQMLTHCVSASGGAVVKTIGDAVMAAFSKPADAVAAALAMQASMRKEPVIPEIGERLALRVGVHTGPCFVVNSNSRLDYFGSTANLAARAQGECPGDGILLTGDVLDAPGVKKALGNAGKTAELVERVIKGFERERLALFELR